MKRYIFISILVFLTGITLFAQGNYTDTQKDFTFVLPDGWQCVKYNNTKYNLAIGERINNLTQTIVISSEEFKGSMQEYLEYSMNDLKQYLPQMVFIKNGDFINHARIEAWKLVAKNNYEDEELRQYYYIFKKENMFFVCVASVSQESSEEIEDVFDASMYTFKFLPKAEEKIENKEDKN